MLLRWLIVVLFIVFLYFHTDISFLVKSSELNLEFSKLAVYATVLLLYSFFEVIIHFNKKLSKNFYNRRISNAMSHLQQAIESIIMKDPDHADNLLDKSKKELNINNVPIITWLKGCTKLSAGNNHEAKSYFYQLVSNKESFLGDYSLYKVAESDGNENNAYDALKHIAEHNKKIPDELIEDFIKLQLLRNEFSSAKEYIKKIKNKRLMSIALYMEDPHSINNLKAAFQDGYDIPDIGIKYANCLLFIGNKKAARKILTRSWNATPTPKLFKALIATDPDKDIDIAKTLINNGSFIGYNEFAKLLYKHGFLNISLQYFKKACAIYQCQETLFYITELASKIATESNTEQEATLSETMLPPPMWRCKKCCSNSENWTPICVRCNTLDSLRWTFFSAAPKQETRLPNLLELK